MLFIVPAKDIGKSSSGIGTYSKCISHVGYDVIGDGSNTAVGKSLYSSYATIPVIDFGKVSQIQEQILNELNNKPHEAIICSNLESVEACIGLGLPKIMPVFYMVHNCYAIFGSKGLGSEKASRIVENSRNTGIQLLVHSPHAINVLRERDLDSKLLPMITLLEKPKHKRKTYLLAIARYDAVKRPEVVVALAKASKLDFVIMCGSSRQKTKWQKLCDMNKVKATIVFDVEGKEKDKLIQEAGVSIMCSEAESFCQAIMETVTYCPTFIVNTKKISWEKNFDHLPIAKYIIHRSEGDLKKAELAKFYTDVGKEIKKAAEAEYAPRKKHAVREQLAEITVGQWKDLPKICHDKERYIAGRSELVKQFQDKGFIDWAKCETLQRTIKGLHEILGTYKCTIKGTVVKKIK